MLRKQIHLFPLIANINCFPYGSGHPRTLDMTNQPRPRGTSPTRNPPKTNTKTRRQFPKIHFLFRPTRRAPAILWTGDYLRRSCGWSIRRRRGRARGRRRATPASALRLAGRRRRCWWCRRPRPGRRRPPPPGSRRSRSRPSRARPAGRPPSSVLRRRGRRGERESNSDEDIFFQGLGEGFVLQRVRDHRIRYFLYYNKFIYNSFILEKKWLGKS